MVSTRDQMRPPATRGCTRGSTSTDKELTWEEQQTTITTHPATTQASNPMRTYAPR